MSDPAGGVGILAALAAGTVSFLLPLVPGYLVLGPSLLFVISFSTIFILLGLSATALNLNFFNEI